MKKLLVLSSLTLFLLAGLCIYQYIHFHDGKLHIVFCDVGQGDAILIVTPNNKHILVDAGPDRKTIDCLSKHMAFWDRTIDLFILTHPHADHFSGSYYVLDRYIILGFATENII